MTAVTEPLTLAQVVGANIRARRLAAGLTQAKLARQLHVGRTHVVRWENGNHLPTDAYLQKIALLLDCRWTDLIRAEEGGA